MAEASLTFEELQEFMALLKQAGPNLDAPSLAPEALENIPFPTATEMQRGGAVSPPTPKSDSGFADTLGQAGQIASLINQGIGATQQLTRSPQLQPGPNFEAQPFQLRTAESASLPFASANLGGGGGGDLIALLQQLAQLGLV